MDENGNMVTGTRKVKKNNLAGLEAALAKGDNPLANALSKMEDPDAAGGATIE